MTLAPKTRLGHYEIQSLPGASKAYQDFFAVWKDADVELSILVEAKKEYEALRSS